jgi:hypothetical protein
MRAQLLEVLLLILANRLEILNVVGDVLVLSILITLRLLQCVLVG